jgi:hypothetical protein
MQVLIPDPVFALQVSRPTAIHALVALMEMAQTSVNSALTLLTQFPVLLTVCIVLATQVVPIAICVLPVMTARIT